MIFWESLPPSLLPITPALVRDWHGGFPEATYRQTTYTCRYFPRFPQELYDQLYLCYHKYGVKNIIYYISMGMRMK